MNKNPKMTKETNTSWTLERESDMNAEVRIFADDNLIKKMQEDATIKQSKNMAKLLGVLEPVVVLADAHQGYGA
ncbi:MAG TPA: RNA-splicing ligase RtcB, partial [Candidatus Pacearchaeota archaeon]|nr:RNA-splicing ligase RtcB [Candidatus Pacearchaeota archaeon]